MAMLNRVFYAFDDMVERRGLEKIKTIGDAYMVAGGVPGARADHAEAVAGLALEMLDFVAGLVREGLAVGLRIGIHSFRTRRRWRHRQAQIQLRHLGRHREHGRAAPDFERARPHPHLRRDRTAARPRLAYRAAGRDRTQGARRGRELLSHRRRRSSSTKFGGHELRPRAVRRPHGRTGILNGSDG
ncbi:MAG TPA: adenylate/guanylate cyclase domain-containing protein [Stellaceae bacterium]|nr:adenylate/guanylate cyclase domain-containing protein [Stellaceae bacterium]